MDKLNVDDPFDLERFAIAQEPVYERVLGELEGGRKRTHWMWFIFPQLRGLGQSSMARTYGIASLDEARAYLSHPALGPHLIACTQRVLAIEGQSLNAIFGSPDDMKFHSSMTLFALAAAEPDNIFRRALARHWAGRNDDATVALLNTDVEQ